MSSSFQTLPNSGLPQQSGQSGMIYPTTTTTTTSASDDPSANVSDHSSGSFGMVFVVLAIILVISAVACILGRFCGKKSDKSHKSNNPKAHKNKNHGKNDHNHNYNRNHNHNHNQNPGGGYNHSHMMNHHQINHPKGGNPYKQHGGGGGKQGGRPKNPDLEFGYRSKEGDIMLGFDPKTKMFPSNKIANNNGDFRVDSMGRGGMHPHHHGIGDPRDYP
ncbi:unnamed protein product [Amaranthus hypochondriacus]